MGYAHEDTDTGFEKYELKIIILCEGFGDYHVTPAHVYEGGLHEYCNEVLEKFSTIEDAMAFKLMLEDKIEKANENVATFNKQFED
jgi:hypothetical protein